MNTRHPEKVYGKKTTKTLVGFNVSFLPHAGHELSFTAADQRQGHKLKNLYYIPMLIFLCLKSSVIRWWHWPGVYVSLCSLALVLTNLMFFQPGKNRVT